MNERLKLIGVGVFAVAVLIGVVFAVKAVFTAGNLDQGQVQYTPGVPPWQEKDPSKRGPGAAPGDAKAPAVPQGSSTTAVSTQGQGNSPAAQAPGAPPAGAAFGPAGGPPVIDNKGK